LKEAIDKAKALIEALGYIRQFRAKIVVVKLGGSLIEQDPSQRDLLTDVVFMATVGMQPILVHGGGKTISAAMQKADIEPQFVQGHRYTDERTLRQTRLDGPEGRQVDIGLVGEITGVNTHLLRLLCQAGTIPVIAPIAIDRSGQKLNVNADIVAGMVAAELKADKLVMMSDTHGIFGDLENQQSQISRLNANEVEQYIKDGTISGGMLPKVNACLKALHAGVGRTHIIDGGYAHSLLLEIYTEMGVGTLIVDE